MTNAPFNETFLARYDASKSPYRVRYQLYADRVEEVHVSRMGNDAWRRTVPLRQLWDSFRIVECQVRSREHSLRVGYVVAAMFLAFFLIENDNHLSPAWYPSASAVIVLSYFVTPFLAPPHSVRYAAFPSREWRIKEQGLNVIESKGKEGFEEFVSQVENQIRVCHRKASGDFES
jgi:hypothetical protein